MNKPKLVGTKEYCQKMLNSIKEIKETTLYGMGYMMSDLPYFISNEETIKNEREICKIIEDKIFDLENTLKEILKSE